MIIIIEDSLILIKTDIGKRDQNRAYNSLNTACVPIVMT